ncbi:hypothetical protein HMPREF3192_00609 [Atopobium deltae]|uniref:Uncharacterized protein n=1 Tax=Atopobium deltae TaxID=1393034 RepID=A0A133XVN2_9ACTN|nr:hypothetical protein HMPREF3192_00609 [Atopobium deltae]
MRTRTAGARYVRAAWVAVGALATHCRHAYPRSSARMRAKPFTLCILSMFSKNFHDFLSFFPDFSRFGSFSGKNGSSIAKTLHYNDNDMREPLHASAPFVSSALYVPSEKLKSLREVEVVSPGTSR